MSSISVGEGSRAIAGDLLKQKRGLDEASEQASLDRQQRRNLFDKELAQQDKTREDTQAFTEKRDEARLAQEAELTLLELQARAEITDKNLVVENRRIELELERLGLEQRRTTLQADAEFERIQREKEMEAARLAMDEERLRVQAEEAKADRNARQQEAAEQRKAIAEGTDKQIADNQAERAAREAAQKERYKREDDRAKKALEFEATVLENTLNNLSGQTEGEETPETVSTEIDAKEAVVRDLTNKLGELHNENEDAAASASIMSVQLSTDRARTFEDVRGQIAEGFAPSEDGEAGSNMTLFISALDEATGALSQEQNSYVDENGNTVVRTPETAAQFVLVDMVAEDFISGISADSEVGVDNDALVAGLRGLVSAHNIKDKDATKAAYDKVIAAVGGSRPVADGLIAGLGDAAKLASKAMEKARPGMMGRLMESMAGEGYREESVVADLGNPLTQNRASLPNLTSMGNAFSKHGVRHKQNPEMTQEVVVNLLKQVENASDPDAAARLVERFSEDYDFFNYMMQDPRFSETVRRIEKNKREELQLQAELDETNLSLGQLNRRLVRFPSDREDQETEAGMRARLSAIIDQLGEEG